jgi:hypothetical protein
VAAPAVEHAIQPQPVDEHRVGAEALDQQLGQRAGALAAARPGAEQRAGELVEPAVELLPVDGPPRRGDREQRLADRRAGAPALGRS